MIYLPNIYTQYRVNKKQCGRYRKTADAALTSVTKQNKSE